MKRMLCLGMFIILCLTYACRLDNPKKEMQAKIGVNQEIAGSYDAALAAVCHNGTFVSEMEGEVLSFRGIPYAEPPVGSLRWKKPVLAGKRDGVYEARHFGKSPVQSEWSTEAGSYYLQGEDCLSLNVWTNASGPTSNSETNDPALGRGFLWENRLDSRTFSF